MRPLSIRLYTPVLVRGSSEITPGNVKINVHVGMTILEIPHKAVDLLVTNFHEPAEGTDADVSKMFGMDRLRIMHHLTNNE